MIRFIASALTVLLLGVNPAAAQAPGGHEGHHAPASAPGASKDRALADGEVRRIDKETGRITIRHGQIPSLDMPPMTMVFRVQDKSLLDQVKIGDKIRFNAIKDGSAYVVTHLEAVN